MTSPVRTADPGTECRAVNRVLIVIDSLAVGGAQRQLQLLAEGLSQRGCAVDVLVLNDDVCPELLSELKRSARVEVVGKLRLIANLGPLALVRRIRRLEPDVILTMLPVADLLGRLAGRIANQAPVITSIRARNSDKSALWLWLDRITMNWACRVVFNSAAVVPFSLSNEGVCPHQVVVIHNGVRIRGGSAPQTWGQELSEGDEVIVAVGRLQPQKRFDILIRAFASLSSRHSRTRLLIAGEGRLQAELQELASTLGVGDRVVFLGRTLDVPALLASANLFVLSSEWEGMPNVVMEAMAVGCPVVATSIDGVRELMPDASFGWLVPPGEVDVLANAMSDVLSDAAEAKRRVSNAQRRVASEFGGDRMAEEYLSLFELVCRGD